MGLSALGGGKVALVIAIFNQVKLILEERNWSPLWLVARKARGDGLF